MQKNKDDRIFHLNDLVLLDGHWRSDPEARLELLDLMKSVSAEWR